MSFFHSTMVGHFDLEKFGPLDQTVSRSIDVDSAKSLLAEFPKHVTGQVHFEEGYVQCWWADGMIGMSRPTRDYAYRLAETQNCIAAETPAYMVEYPEGAKERFMKIWTWRQEQIPPRQPMKPSRPGRMVPKPIPCSYCGKLLRTGIARQCRHCKMDWHDLENIRHLGVD